MGNVKVTLKNEWFSKWNNNKITANIYNTLYGSNKTKIYEIELKYIQQIYSQSITQSACKGVTEKLILENRTKMKKINDCKNTLFQVKWLDKLWQSHLSRTWLCLVIYSMNSSFAGSWIRWRCNKKMISLTNSLD